jgi:hypothetical protein
MAGKISYIASLLLRVGFLGVFAGGIGVIVDQVAARLLGYNIEWSSSIEAMMSNRLAQVISLIVAVVVVRRVIIRLNDPDMTR